MKRLFYLSCIFILCSVMGSCKKDTASPAPEELLLTGISRNGLNLMELTYDTDKRLIRVNYYSSNGSLSTYTLFEYDEKGVSEAKRFDADDHGLEYRRVFSLDNFGRVIRSDNYSLEDSEDLSSISEFEYNASDQLIGEDFRVPGNPVFQRDENTYDQQGNLIRSDRIYYPAQSGEYLRSRAEYTPGSMPLPAEWKHSLFLLDVLGLDSWVYDIFMERHYSSWNDEGTLSSDVTYTASEQQYNSRGYLTNQVITRNDLLEGDPVSSTEYSYSYTQ